MKKHFLIFFVLLSQFIAAQHFTVVKTEKYTGAIIPSEYFAPDKNQKMFTPTEAEIVILEAALVAAKNNLHSNEIVGFNESKFLYKDLTPYYRQYSGFYHGSKKVIVITFIPTENVSTPTAIEKWKSEWISCSKCFDTNYDVSNKEFYESGNSGQ